jgi:hypothetical protein
MVWVWYLFPIVPFLSLSLFFFSRPARTPLLARGECVPISLPLLSLHQVLALTCQQVLFYYSMEGDTLVWWSDSTNRPTLSKQVFAIQLAGHLSTRYSIPKMLTAARRSLGKMHDLAHADASKIADFFAPSRQALVLMCVAGPLCPPLSISLARLLCSDLSLALLCILFLVCVPIVQ